MGRPGSIYKIICMYILNFGSKAWWLCCRALDSSHMLLTCAFLILVCFPHLVIFPKPGSRQWTSALNTSEQIIQCAQRQKETERTSEREQWKIEDDANNTARIYSSVCVCVCPENCKDKEGTLDARTDWLTASLSSVMCVCLCEGGKAATTYRDSSALKWGKKC